MAVFIEITTDAFQDTFAKKTADAVTARRAGSARARRPLRGLEIKEDTYAIIKLIQANGTEIPLMDSGSNSGSSPQYSNFIMQSAQEARMEKHQIVETFGESYLFLFGEAPRFLDVAAILVNSNDFNWRAEWWANYDTFLRGTKSVELGARTYLFYDDIIVEGYILNAQAMEDANNPLLVNLSFRLFITNYQNISFVGDPNFPIRSTVVLPDSMDANSLSSTLSAGDLNTLIGTSEGFDDNGNALGGFDLARSIPIRSLISDNTDEWTGQPQETQPDPFDALKQQVQEDIQESQDLLRDLINDMKRFGVDVDGPAFMFAMGLGPNFTKTEGFGIGAGAGFSASASFSASFNISASISASVSFGTQNTDSSLDDQEQQELDEVLQQQVLEAQAQIQLDQNGGPIIFSASDPPDFEFSASASFSVSASVSFGNAGNVNSDPTRFVLSAGASYAGGSSSSASTAVGGTPSAFALASFGGTLDPTGGSSDVASASIGIGGP